MSRVVVPALDAILDNKIHVLNRQGWFKVVDYMGGDKSVMNAARNTVEGAKIVHSDKGLLRYLLRHWHCYAPWMHVLTDEGWKRWDECSEFETFLVPNPDTKEVTKERLRVEMFDASEESLVCCRSQRIEFYVTTEHKMRFRNKNDKDFDWKVYSAKDMPQWGHLDSIKGYSYCKNLNSKDLQAEFVGFYLGDGSYSSPNRISFNLKKERKKVFLRNLLDKLEISYTEKENDKRENVTFFSVVLPDFLRLWVSEITDRANKKDLNYYYQPSFLSSDQILGLFNGLVESDGHFSSDRNQIQFSSISPYLIDLIQTLSAYMGIDAHKTKSFHGVDRVYIYLGNDIRSMDTLELRGDYFYTEDYNGKVYCTTTSTGWLTVRGSDNTFAFISGNSTPFEFATITLQIYVPMDCWRQWIRHRMFSVNEYSTRYSEAINECQTTSPGSWRIQSTENRQGSSNEYLYVGDPSSQEYYEGLDKSGHYFTEREHQLHRLSREIYQERLDAGIANEQARKDLPLSNFTLAYWSGDLWNLMHFLHLRMDEHAQKEIREYATKIGERIVALWAPESWQAFKDYRLYSQQLSRMESLLITEINKVIRLWIDSGCSEKIEYESVYELADSFGWIEYYKLQNCYIVEANKTNRERDEFEVKAKLLHIPIPWRIKEVS